MDSEISNKCLFRSRLKIDNYFSLKNDHVYIKKKKKKKKEITYRIRYKWYKAIGRRV
jgi:hypothetical protein